MTDPLLLPDIVRASASRVPNQPAVSLGTRTYTYAELADRMHHVAAVLAARGIGHGDRVTWWGEPTVDVVPLYYGLAVLGAVFVPMNPRFTPTEARGICDLVEPDLRLADEAHDGDLMLDAVLGQRTPATLDVPGVRETDPDVIFCTSGTTGNPKGVVLSQRANWLRAESVDTHPGTNLSMFPHFHWGGWSFVHPGLLRGYHVVLPESADAESLLDAIERHRVASFYAIPAVWRRILESDLSGRDVSSLREAATGTSSTPLDLLHAIHDALPATTSCVRYGATEAGSLARLYDHELEAKPGSVGRPSPGFTVQLVDGELWVRGPQLSLGYFRNPEANADAFVDGWYRTGDLVERDDEGYISVVGRVKDMIRTGGEYVAPAEVDVVLRRHPAVADIAVAGVPDEAWGEVVVAFAVLRPGATLTIADLRAHCEGELSTYKHPRQLHLVDAVPRTGATGQVQRRRLVEIAQSL